MLDLFFSDIGNELPSHKKSYWALENEKGYLISYAPENWAVGSILKLFDPLFSSNVVLVLWKVNKLTCFSFELQKQHKF